MFAVFTDAGAALRAAVHAQGALRAHPWPEDAVVRVRMGLHTGHADIRDGEYVGLAVHQAARVVRVAHGGQVVCSSATAADAKGAEVALVDLGEFTVRDFERGERLFQVTAPGDPSTFPAINAVPAVAHNLPLSRNAFLGRGKEIEELTSHLKSHRLVTVLGPGGIGKTRLSFELTRNLAPSYTDGATVVFLAAVSDSDGVIPAIAKAAGLLEEPGKPLRTTVLDTLSRRSAMLVLDNCEHLRDSVADVIQELIDRAPHLAVLTTSRRALDVSGECLYPLGPMAVPPVDSRTDEVIASEAVRLFVERARAVRPSFALNDEAADAVGRICRYLEGLPLAIELAAARVRSMLVNTLAERVHDTTRLLTSGSPSGDSRQRTVTALVEWSLDLLSADELRLMSRLSVFRGGFELEAAEAVGGFAPLDAPNVVDLLDALVQHSLVGLDENGRYRVLVVVRDVAALRLRESGEEATARAAHLEYFAGLASRTAEELRGPNQVAFGQRLDVELDNIRAALEWGLAREGDRSVAGLLALRLNSYWHRRYLHGEERRWLGLVTDASLDVRDRVQLRHRRTILNDDLDVGRRYKLLEALLRETEGDARALVRCSLATLGSDPGEAARHLDAAASEAVNPGAQRDVAYVRGRMEALRDNTARALELWNYVATAARVAGDLQQEAMVAIAQAALILNDSSRAAESVEGARRAVAISRDIGDVRLECQAITTLGGALFVSNDYAAARDAYDDGIKVARRVGWTAQELVGVGNVAELDLVLGRYEDARTGTLRVLGSGGDEIWSPHERPHWLNQLANIEFSRDLPVESLAILRQPTSRRGNTWPVPAPIRATTSALRGLAAVAAGDLAAADGQLRDSLDIQPGSAGTLGGLAVVARKRSGRARALPYGAEALEILAAPGPTDPQAMALVAAAIEGEPAVILSAAIESFCNRTGYVLALPVRHWLDAALEECRASMSEHRYESLARAWSGRSQQEAAGHVLDQYLKPVTATADEEVG